MLRELAKEDASRAPELLTKARHRAEQSLAIFTDLRMPAETNATRQLLDELGGASTAI